ncbi:lytic transglycosylase domain-containing protein [Rhodopseudomonas sp. NSM]|uniref:lytic transglycosylase domain-containing protein n=1 Tax=Rhodopseudomonas sp. NSM TaxID=3457630 RepID=UPI0040358EB7
MLIGLLLPASARAEAGLPPAERRAAVAIGVAETGAFESGPAESGPAEAAEPVPGETADGGEGIEPLPLLVFERVAARALSPADLPPANVLLGGGAGSNSVSRRLTASFSREWRAGRDVYRPIVEREAASFRLPPALLDAVMAVESSYNPGVVGMDGEIGLMQLMPATARMMGFTGSNADLANPDINIHYGARYLAGAWRLAKEDVCTAAMKYRAGHGETRFSVLSVEYCIRVRNHLAARGVTVSGEIPKPTFGARTATGGRPAGRLMSVGSVNLAELNTRLRSLTERVPGK